MMNFMEHLQSQMVNALQRQDIDRENIGQGYTLEWLDLLITVSLNPSKTDFNAVSKENVENIRSKIAEEKQRLQSFMKHTVFSLGDEKRIRLFIKQYHSSLIRLLDQAVENRIKCPFKKGALKELTGDLVTCMDELLVFIEKRFLDYLSADELVPATFFSTALKGIRKQLDELKPGLKNRKRDKKIVEILLQELQGFVDRAKMGHLILLKDVDYIKELLHKLADLTAVEAENSIFTTFDQLLIQMNFNCRLYTDYLIQLIIEKKKNVKELSEKLELLLLHNKILNQIEMRPDIALNPKSPPVKTVLNNWFNQEILYLKSKSGLLRFREGRNEKNLKEEKSGERKKVLCRLSTDQIGIILRAAEELKVLKARSMSEVFKTIVPHLSTPRKENLSYDSMRSKSYVAETSDKEIAIKTLEQIIEKVREY